MNIGEVVKGIFAFLFEDALTTLLQPFLKLMNVIALSPDTLAKMKWIQSMYPVMVSIGLAICLLITMWQGLKSMLGTNVGIEADEPVHIAVKAFLGFFVVYYIKDILLQCVGIMSGFASMITEQFSNAPEGPNFFELAWLRSNPLYVLLGLFLVFKCIGLFWRMFKRLALCGVLILCSPLAAACMVSKMTAGFWQGFVKLVAGNLAIQLIQSVCFCIIMLCISDLSAIPVAGDVTNIFQIMLTIALVDVTSNLEDIIRDMSFGIGIGRDMQGAMGKIQGAAITANYASGIAGKLG